MNVRPICFLAALATCLVVRAQEDVRDFTTLGGSAEKDLVLDGLEALGCATGIATG